MMSEQFVPVKTKYPGRPPKGEPQWVHLDWIQTTAAILAEDWLSLRGQHENWVKFRQLGIDDPTILCQQQRWNHLWEEVIPLFNEVMAYFPLEAWSRFTHVRNSHGADESPEDAVREWNAIRDYAMDKLYKPETASGKSTSISQKDFGSITGLSKSQVSKLAKKGTPITLEEAQARKSMANTAKRSTIAQTRDESDAEVEAKFRRLGG